jgi:hypothetical protein
VVGEGAVCYRRTLRMDPDRRRLHAAGVPDGSALGRRAHYRTVQPDRPEGAMPRAAEIERPATAKGDCPGLSRGGRSGPRRLVGR